jgi:hypothetical protein
MEAQQSDFQSWSNLESSGFRNGSFNVLSIKRKRMHNELVLEEEHQKELAWQRENVSLRTRRRADRERRSQSRTPSITSKVPSRDLIDIHSIDEAQPAVELPAEENRDPVPAVELPAEDNRQFVPVNDTSEVVPINQSLLNVTVNEEKNDDSSTGRRSRNSNETHRLGPMYQINRPRATTVVNRHGSTYLHGIDEPYQDYSNTLAATAHQPLYVLIMVHTSLIMSCNNF